MARIQASTGLITGIPIADTVDKLMELASRPRDTLKTNTTALQTQQTAVTELSALLLSVKYITHNLGQAAVFDRKEAASSNSSVLTAQVTGDAATGSYQFTPLRKAQSQQWLSSSFSSDGDPIGGGTVTFRFGGTVERAAPMSLLNGGAGFTRGTIRITDRSGARADIDLSAAQTIDDVLDAVNANTQISVTAAADGDHIRLTDNTGQTAANLKVQDIGSGRTAASLGLAGIDVAADAADGQDLVRLYAGLDLDALNDGNGVRTNPVLSDIDYTLRDGTTGSIDLSPIRSGSSEVLWERTLGDVIEAFNAANPDKLKLEIASDGSRLVATDLTTGDGTFTLAASHGSGALADLGLTGTAADGTITGRRLVGGLRTVLLSSLNGGQGPGALGSLTLTDRAGESRTVDLAQAETLDDVIDAIHAAGIGVAARVNDARNGIVLSDTATGTGHFTVENADGTNTADKLNIAVSAGDAATSVNSGDLHLQVVAENTRLADLNGGGGVAKGTFTIRDTTGASGMVNLRSTSVQTVGDVIRVINRLGLQVRAEINDAGDGIRLVDTGHGTGTLEVDEGSSTSARDLHLDRAAVDAQVDGETTKVIDGATTYTVQIGEDDTLADLVGKINALGAGVTATKFVQQAGQSYRLSLTSQRAGKVGELVIDTSDAAFSLEETVHGQDALLVFGDPAAPASNVFLSSLSNTFRDVVPGVSLEVKQTSSQPVTVTVSTSDASVVANVKTMVDNYNKFRKRLSELTAYNAETNTRSALTGDAAALRLDTDLSLLLSGRFGTGSVQSLRQVGIALKTDGTLELDQDKLKTAYADDPEAVRQLFAAKDVGVSARFDKLIDQIAGESNSLLTNRINVLKDRIQDNQDRTDSMTKRLNDQRERLLTQFYNIELAIGKLQSNLSVIEGIQPIDFLAYTSTSS